MQYHSNTGEGSLSVFLAELVQRHLGSVLAANEPESTPEKKQMSEDAQALVVSCMESVRTLAWKYADGSYDRFEELVSIGMLGVCEAAASLPADVSHPQGYLCQAARHDMIDELDRLHACSTASLDAPLSDTGSFTLHDLLPSLAAAAVAPASKRERALHGALLRLSVRQRAAVRRRAGLPGYGVHSPEEIARALHTSSIHAAHCLNHEGRRKLRQDARLRKVMGVEVER